MPYTYKKGKAVYVKTPKEKLIHSAKTVSRVVIFLLVVFMVTCTVLYIKGFNELHNQISVLEKENAIYREQNEELNKLLKDANNEINELKKYIDTNKDRFEKANNIINKNNELIKQNKNLEDKVEGLKEYIAKSLNIEILDVKKVKLEVTKYTNAEGWWKPGDPRWGTMASGQKTYRGAVAMPRTIPFGTKVILDDNSKEASVIYDVKDRGGAIVEKQKGDEIIYCMDIWTNSKEDAYKWGRQTKEGWLYYINK